MPPKKEADMELYAAIDLHSNNSVQDFGCAHRS